MATIYYYILLYEETFLQNTFVIFVDIRNATIDTVCTVRAPPFDRHRDLVSHVPRNAMQINFTVFVRFIQIIMP